MAVWFSIDLVLCVGVELVCVFMFVWLSATVLVS